MDLLNWHIRKGDLKFWKFFYFLRMVCYWFRRWRLSQPETEQQKIERSKKEKENSPDSNVCLCEKVWLEY